MDDRDGVLSPGEGDALLIVDVQNDFLPNGHLPVPHGDAVIEPLNRYIALFCTRGLPVIAARESHPPNHCSFRRCGGPWPPHCVRNTMGAEITPALHLPNEVDLIEKGTDPDDASYSAFAVAGFPQRLRSRGIRRLFVGGLATDYCVRDTVLDALRHGFPTVVLFDAIRAVDVEPGDGNHAMQAMTEAGAIFRKFEDLSR